MVWLADCMIVIVTLDFVAGLALIVILLLTVPPLVFGIPAV